MTEPSAAPNTNPVFHIEKLYLKDFSFENPNAPELYSSRQEPQVEFNLGTTTTQKGASHFEVALQVMVKVQVEGRAMFLVELTYAGLFLIENLPQDQINMLLGIECPTILFPYVREIVSSTVMDGGYRPMVLDPVNFAAIYHQQQRERKEGSAQ